MSEDFVSFEIAKKLKEKGFTCKYPFAMYNELGVFHPLYTSYDETLVNCTFGNREYYDYDDFDDRDCVCPTISQVLKWLREEKTISVEPCATPYNCWFYMIKCKGEIKVTYTGNKYKTYKAAAIAGIEYARDNLI